MKTLFFSLLISVTFTFAFSQDYTTTLDTFYVQTPEYKNSLNVDSIHFPCAITQPTIGIKFPILILVHGTSVLDKDANSTKDFKDNINGPYRKAQTQLFRDIADSLSRNGIMVFRYDKRSFTVNCIEKPECWFVDTISPRDYMKDIESAIDFVKTLPNVDTCNIFLAGHSQGGSFVSAIGNKRNDVRGILNMAGTALPIDSVLINQFKTINSDPAGANILRDQFDSLRNGLWPMTQTLYENHFSPRFLLDWISHTDSAIIVQQNSMKPTAFMNGTADRFVPSSIHHQAWVDQVNQPNATFKLFDDIDHSFGTEYDSTMSLEVLQFMIEWIQENTQNCNVLALYPSAESSSTLTIYPNPSTNKLMIYSFHSKDPYFQLINSRGEVIRSISSEKALTELDISELKKGVYFIQSGTSSSKFIKN